MGRAEEDNENRTFTRFDGRTPAGSSPILFVSFGVVLAGVYVTVSRWAYPRLPDWLHTETVALTWKDLRLPALLAVISVGLGLMSIL